MSKVCIITGKKTLHGNRVSHSNIKTKRVFNPNLQVKTFYIEEDDLYVTLKLSAKGIRTIDKIGIKAALKKAEAKGFI
jgi:large subunit ribosomal protein L28